MELEIQLSDYKVVLAQLPDQLVAPSKPQTRSDAPAQRDKHFPERERRPDQSRNEARSACRAGTGNLPATWCRSYDRVPLD